MITVEAMILEADINSKSYRKALAAIDELGAENCNVILQGSMKIQGKIEGAGLAVQPKKAKEEPKEGLNKKAEQSFAHLTSHNYKTILLFSIKLTHNHYNISKINKKLCV